MQPNDDRNGKKLPRSLSADIVISSHDHPRHNNIEAIGGEPFVITGPGEYEVKDVFINGVGTFHDLVEGKEKGVNTIFYVNIAGMHLLHLGDLKHPVTVLKLVRNPVVLRTSVGNVYIEEHEFRIVQDNQTSFSGKALLS